MDPVKLGPFERLHRARIDSTRARLLKIQGPTPKVSGCKMRSLMRRWQCWQKGMAPQREALTGVGVAAPLSTVNLFRPHHHSTLMRLAPWRPQVLDLQRCPSTSVPPA